MTLSPPPPQTKNVSLPLTSNVLTELQATVQENESLWQAILEASNDGVWNWNIQTNEAKYSKRWKSILGYDEHDILPSHDEWLNRIHPDDQQYVTGAMQAYLTGQSETYCVEYRLKSKDESYRWILGRGTLISRSADGKPLRMVGTHTDITERKLREEQRLAEEIVLRETLVREVHHRIKNNLQGVTGLLSNFSEKYPALTIPIREAISQIQSIAIIHGLQGRRSHSKVRLCEVISEIAALNKSLWGTPVVVDLPPNWPPHLLAEAEAVPIAMICNELITNAIKHGDRTKSVTITLRRELLINAVRVSICNVGQLSQAFNLAKLDLAQLSICGTGLSLIGSLLPKTGAHLQFSQRDGMITVTLDLESPIVSIETEL